MAVNTYVLIEGENIETNWYELVEEKDDEKIERLTSKFSNNLATQFLNGRQGLDKERMDKFLWQFITNLYQYLNEGKKLLFNRLGGMMFLDDRIHILKKVYDTSFPCDAKNFGLSGWLTPDGEFYRCEYGEHWKFSQSQLNKDEDSLRQLQYVSMGSVGYNFQKNSHFFVPSVGFTEKQKQWLKNNYQFLDEEQRRILDETNQ